MLQHGPAEFEASNASLRMFQVANSVVVYSQILAARSRT